MKDRLHILMCLAMISWGIAWTNAKIVNDYFSYNNLVFMRYFSSFIVFLPILLLRGKSFLMPSRITIINIALVSFLYYLYNIYFFMGTDVGSAGKGGVFVTTINPIITFLIISLINKSMNKTQILGVFIGALGGCIILDVFRLGIESFFIHENFYFLICAITWGVITVVMTYGQKEYDSLSYIFLCYFLTSIIAFFFVDFSELTTLSNYSNRFLINFFFVSIGAMCFGTSIYMYAGPRLGAVETSVFIFTVPFIAISTANIFLGEAITLNLILGGCMAIISVYLVNFKS